MEAHYSLLQPPTSYPSPRTALPQGWLNIKAAGYSLKAEDQSEEQVQSDLLSKGKTIHYHQVAKFLEAILWFLPPLIKV